MSFKKSINPVTGNTELSFEAKLVSISNDVVGRTPNGKDYRVATISFKGANGKSQQVTALVFEANYVYGMTEGQSYATKAVITKDRPNEPLIVMSHLSAASRATLDMFGDAFGDISEGVPANEAAEDDDLPY